jgi:nucleotide-binding universal stress UspA family protein
VIPVRGLRFADEAARLRGASLRLVHAWTLPYLGFAGSAGTPPQETIDEIAAQASENLLDSIRRGSVDAMRADVELSLVEGSPVPSLRQAPDNADLSVVGSRGYGGWKGLLMGSVATHA